MNMTTVPSNQLKAMQHEIADLKEQITNAKYNYLGAMADCKQYEETIAQQAEAIRVKNEALFTAYTTFTEYAQIHSAKQPPDTRKSAFNFDRANQMNGALAIQPSPEILQARDEWVAEACAKLVNRFISGGGILNDTWVHEIEDEILSGEWRKYL